MNITVFPLPQSTGNIWDSIGSNKCMYLPVYQNGPCASRLFTKLIKPVYATFRSAGFISVAYIDDSLHILMIHLGYRWTLFIKCQRKYKRIVRVRFIKLWTQSSCKSKSDVHIRRRTDVTGQDKATWQDFVFSGPLYFFPHSFSSSYFLPLFHYLISILLFPGAGVWENTRAWVPHFLLPHWMELAVFGHRYSFVVTCLLSNN